MRENIKDLLVTDFQEIAGIPEKYKSFAYRFLRNTWGFIALFALFGLILIANQGARMVNLLLSGGTIALALLYGLRMSVKVLSSISLNEAGEIRIETLRFNQVKTVTKHKRDVKVNVLQDATSRYVNDMIRIDIHRKTYFVQKQFLPWTAGKIQDLKEVVKQGKL